MSAPGFHGKLPQAGDFLTRGLPAAFVRPWDRWASRHLVPGLPPGAAVCFLLAVPPGPAAGAALGSADRAGRRFPLTLAALLPPPTEGFAVAAASWFAALVEAGEAAVRGALGAEALAARLAALPPPAMPGGPPAPPLLLWRPGGRPRAAPPGAAGAALAEILSSD